MGLFDQILSGPQIDLSSPTGVPNYGSSTLGYSPLDQANFGASVPLGGQSNGTNYLTGISTGSVPSTPYNSNPIGSLFGGLGDTLTGAIKTAINGGVNSIANKIAAGPTFKGNTSGKSNTANSNTGLLNISTGSLLIIGAVVVGIFLLKK